MQYIEAFGYKLSKLTLGTVQLGMTYGMANTSGKPDDKEAAALLAAAVQGGINWFDTAAAYGDSETVLGNYFGGHTGTKPYFVSKCMVNAEKGTSAGDIERQFTQSVENSLEQLKISRLPLVLLHTPANMHMYGDAVPAAFASLKRQGLVEHTGVSIYDKADVDATLKYEVFEAVQVPMNALDRRLVLNGSLANLKAAGYTVFVRSVFLQGLFFMPQLPDDLASAAPFVARLREIADKAGFTMAQMLFAYIRDLDGVSSLVLGAEKAHQIEENIKLLETPPLPSSAVEAIEALDPPIEHLMEVIKLRGGR